MATTLTLRLSTKASGLKGKLAIVCTVKGSSTRHSIQVSGLKAPSYTPDYWNEKQGLFIAGENAAYNNQVTKTLLEELEAMIKEGNFPNGKQLFDAYKYAKTHVEASKTITLGQYVEILLKNEKERPSANYEQYNTLLNKLEGINRKNQGHYFNYEQPPKFNGVRLFDIPLKDINNQHFKAFGDWVKANKCNYRNLMTTFRAVISKAVNDGLRDDKVNYKWQKDAPIKAKKEMTAKQSIEAVGSEIPILSEKEFKRFEVYDVLKNAPKQGNFRKLIILYKDILLLMYYTKSRPIDVLSWDWVHNYCEETNQIVYTPHKLKHRRGKQCVVPLSEKAVEIIQRYKGKSKGGYIIPHPMNEISWDINNPQIYRTWNTRVKGVEGCINKWLKDIAKELKLEVSNLKMYDFRHSAITHAINAGEDIFKVAVAAGTSVIQIEKHYFNSVRK